MTFDAATRISTFTYVARTDYVGSDEVDVNTEEGVHKQHFSQSGGFCGNGGGRHNHHNEAPEVNYSFKIVIADAAVTK